MYKAQMSIDKRELAYYNIQFTLHSCCSRFNQILDINLFIVKPPTEFIYCI